ncbi:MAG: hypothetical protein ACKVP3_23040 [Hyphomicrobiaceae bacterium]
MNAIKATLPSLSRIGAAFAFPDPLDALCEKYHVPYGDWRMLVLELAATHEKGFKPSKAGRPREVPAWLFEEYVVFFSRPRRQSLRRLAEKMHREFPEVAPPPDTLRKHFAKARDVANQRWRVRIAEALTTAG